MRGNSDTKLTVPWAMQLGKSVSHYPSHLNSLGATEADVWSQQKNRTCSSFPPHRGRCRLVCLSACISWKPSSFSQVLLWSTVSSNDANDHVRFFPLFSPPLHPCLLSSRWISGLSLEGRPVFCRANSF